jgi:hypothetical protein
MKKVLIVSTIFLGVFFQGCNESALVSALEDAHTQKHFCKNPRPKICTFIYAPVCGKPTYKTYPNACSACRDEDVKYYIKGKCK